jgi:hypothetical protein
MKTKEMASILGITSKELRRILRSYERFADGKYTRYTLTKRDLAQVTKTLATRSPEPAKVKKVSKKKPTASVTPAAAIETQPTV